MIKVKCPTKDCQFYDSRFSRHCSRSGSVPPWPYCNPDTPPPKNQISLDEHPEKSKYPHKPLPTFPNSFWETYSLTVPAFKGLTPFQKETVIQEFSELINTLSVRLRLLVSLK